MALWDINFNFFRRKKINNSELISDKALFELHQDIANKVEETKYEVSKLSEIMTVHIAVQKEQWEKGCPATNSMKWMKPSIILSLIIGAFTVIKLWGISIWENMR